MKPLFPAVMFLIAGTVGAAAQSGYVITTPGQSSTYIDRNHDGSYTVKTPGEVPTYVDPLPGGAYRITTPGGTTGYIDPIDRSTRYPNYNPQACTSGTFGCR